MTRDEFWVKLNLEMREFGQIIDVKEYPKTVAFTLEIDIEGPPDLACKANYLKQLRICLNALGISPSLLHQDKDHVVKPKDKYGIRYVLTKPPKIIWEEDSRFARSK